MLLSAGLAVLSALSAWLMIGGGAAPAEATPASRGPAA
jgi:hypothetical protein